LAFSERKSCSSRRFRLSWVFVGTTIDAALLVDVQAWRLDGVERDGTARRNLIGSRGAGVQLNKTALRPSANLGRARLFSLEVSHQPLKSRLIRVVILPIAEVWNEVLSNLAGGTDFNGNDTFT
jgi:hypothetical protein